MPGIWIDMMTVVGLFELVDSLDSVWRSFCSAGSALKNFGYCSSFLDCQRLGVSPCYESAAFVLLVLLGV